MHARIKPLETPGRMAPTDALFWYAETALPSLRPIIAGLYVLDRPPRSDWIERSYESLLASVPRLRQRVVEAPLGLAPPEWIEDPHFDRAYHQRHLSLAAPGGMSELLTLSAQLLATPLDRQRPLWEAYWIDGLDGGRTAYFFKIHHSCVDGVGSIALLEALTQGAPDSPPPRVRKRDSRTRLLSPLPSTASLVLDHLTSAFGFATEAARLPLRMFADPVGTRDQAARIIRGLQGVLADAGQSVIEDPLARSTSGLSRRLDVMQVPMARLCRIKDSLGVSLNDVVLAAFSACLGAYHRERAVQVPVLNCMVPMNLRTASEKTELGNRVGVMNIVLPVGERRIGAMLQRIVDQTRRAKRDRRGAAYPFLIGVLGLMPAAVFGWMARQGLGRVNVACTNIPGLAEARYLAGARIEAIYPFASVVEKTPLVMALVSYAGTMDIGIDTDPEAIPDPHRISTLFLDALRQLEELARVEHGSRERDGGSGGLS